MLYAQSTAKLSYQGEQNAFLPKVKILIHYSKKKKKKKKKTKKKKKKNHHHHAAQQQPQESDNHWKSN